jgi:hypothetical protein
MSIRKITKLLEEALLHDGKMEQGLYEFELEEKLEGFKASIAEDNHDYLYSVTENRGHIAMVLIEKSGEVHINEQARERLKALWSPSYETNMKMMIPDMAKQLRAEDLPVTGVKVVP